jgi:hypothetical protein
MARRRQQPVKWHRHRYSTDDFTQMANVLGVDRNLVEAQSRKIEEAARWLYSDSATPRRTPPSKLRDRMKRIARAAEKLLRELGAKDLDDAYDGRVDDDVMNYLVSGNCAGEEDLVAGETRQVGQLAEIVARGVRAAKSMRRRAIAADPAIARVSEATLPKGHVGDWALNNWIEATMTIYVAISGKPPTTWAPSSKPHTRQSGGPLIRFLAAAASPLGIAMKPNDWRNRVRAPVDATIPAAGDMVQFVTGVKRMRVWDGERKIATIPLYSIAKFTRLDGGWSREIKPRRDRPRPK